MGLLFTRGVHKRKVPVYNSYWPFSVRLPVTSPHYGSAITQSADTHKSQSPDLWAHRTSLRLGAVQQQLVAQVLLASLVHEQVELLSTLRSEIYYCSSDFNDYYFCISTKRSENPIPSYQWVVRARHESLFVGWYHSGCDRYFDWFAQTLQRRQAGLRLGASPLETFAMLSHSAEVKEFADLGTDPCLPIKQSRAKLSKSIPRKRPFQAGGVLPQSRPGFPPVGPLASLSLSSAPVLWKSRRVLPRVPHEPFLCCRKCPLPCIESTGNSKYSVRMLLAPTKSRFLFLAEGRQSPADATPKPYCDVSQRSVDRGPNTSSQMKFSL